MSKRNKDLETRGHSKPNWKNRTLFHGDNLAVMRGMNSETVDLIATDPPFNKSKDFHATPDSLAKGASFQDRWSWEKDVHESWTDKIVDDYPKLMEAIECARYAHSDGMGAFMCFMAVRLIEMHRVLKPTGSLYLHCDPTASHYLKTIMDAILGYKNFQNEIMWCYNVGGKSKKRWARKHDVILFYTQSRKKFTFNGESVGIARNTGSKSFGGKIGIDSDGRKYQDKVVKSSGKVYRYYLNELKTPEDWWSDINSLQSGTKERVGYPTQKPLALYERIIKASSNEGDVVLDPFCGCATTCVAAERLDRQWVGIDIWKNAHGVILSRFEKEGLSVEGKNNNELFTFGNVYYTKELPERTDDGEEAVPFLRVKEKVVEPEGKKWTRTECLEYLLKQHGSKCQGCDRIFDDPRYLELDHNTPRADGGINHVTNRVLLCGPCNKLKSHRYTLSGLRKQNKKLGYMTKDQELFE